MKSKITDLRVTKKAILLFALISLASCQCKKNTTPAEAVAITSECPKDGTCSVKLLKDKSIAVKKDEFGRLYYTLEESTSKNVVHYIYKRTVKGDLQDASYREEIVFEIDAKSENLHIADAALENKQLLFGRFCFCRGQTGYYKINHGNLTVTNGKIVDLNFKTDEVPQIIKHITVAIK